MAPENNKLRHIILSDTAQTERYRSVVKGRSTPLKTPDRDRQIHGRSLISQIQEIQRQEETLKEQRRAQGIGLADGICIAFEGDPEFDIKLESLEFQPSGIELLTVKKVDERIIASVFVPEGKLDFFIKRIEKYLTEETQKGRPRHQDLVEGISHIRHAVLEALWSDADDELPVGGVQTWWEVWFRSGPRVGDIRPLLSDIAPQLGLIISRDHIKFPDRTVVLIQSTREQLAQSVDLLNLIAEIRKPKDHPGLITDMSQEEQSEWVDDLLTRIITPEEGIPAVCLLDSGINNGHPLLQIAVNDEDVHTVDPSWGTADNVRYDGHGTKMAGIALYGDLLEIMSSSGPIPITHILESVKILPPSGDNEPHLYGSITAEAIARVEVQAPDRLRSICLPVTSLDARDRGRPSSWSAALDNLSDNNGGGRLIFVSAGNVFPMQRISDYPAKNQTSDIEDPGQAWNALTIGAYTEKDQLDNTEYPDYSLVAEPGELSPSSTTSLTWDRINSPLKPDIVLEGGNMAADSYGEIDNHVDSLQLLTTNWRPHEFLLTTTHQTSAATALAARMGAIILSDYPNFWPETVRGLLVHSAEWTGQLRQQCEPLNSRSAWENLLRFCGYGIPSLNRALYSASNSLTLIAQEVLQPFDRDVEQSRIVTRDMHLHSIPWPTETLRDLGETPVEMRVTLSYFIEPCPGRRGPAKRYRYASHGLRFEVMTALEDRDQFRRRINRIVRDEEGGATTTGDSAEWLLGPTLRTRGSVHSDIWEGTAADLAERDHIAIFPVGGWWKERHHLGRWNSTAKYSLIVTIRTPEEKVDLYTPVVNQIEIPIEIEV